MRVSVSILSNDYKPQELIKKINNTKADYLHIDFMDGKFVKNKSYTMTELKKFSDLSNKKLDVHLMVDNPYKYIGDLALLNTEYITFHYEAVSDINSIISHIQNYGIKVGISISPCTDVSVLFPYLKYVDLVLIMSVEPGSSGQKFLDGVLYKVEVLKKEIEEKKYYKTIISIDGGINDENIEKVKSAGVDMIVSASYLQEGNMNFKINEIKNH